jgi:Fic family protein
MSMLFNTPKLSAKDLEVIRLVDEVKAKLGYALGSPSRWTGLLSRNTLGRAIQGSNSIEGYNVSVEDAIAAVQGEAPLDADRVAWVNVVGYRRAMTYVIQLAKDPHFSYSDAVIRALHFMMLEHDLTKNPGRWRPGPIFVYDEEKKEQVYEGPEGDLVPDLAAELVRRLAQDDTEVPCMVRAAMAHLNLVMIHPFSDGNGRMGRCLQTLVLGRSGTLTPEFASIEEELSRKHRAYYDVLANVGQGRWHPENDAGPWIRFCLTAHFAQANRLLRRTREIARLWNAVEQAIQQYALPERVTLAVVDAALGHKVRNATYRSAADVTNDLASRDLKTLVDAGLLIGQGERRGRYYVASDNVREIRAKTREQRVVIDPYAETASLPATR